MDKNEVLLSFIIPVYNVEEYLEECLDSLILQDISCDDYEIICVDDGSTDKSGKILDAYAEKNENIVVVHKENGGVSSARNCGIDIAKGQYIWFVDADDFIRRNALSKIKSLILENKYDVIKILPYSFKDGETDVFTNAPAPAMSQQSIKDFLWTYILRSEHIHKNKIYFDTRISYAEDAVFMLQVNPFMQEVARITDGILYFYRQRLGSAVGQSINKKINSRMNAVLVCNEIIQGERVGNVVLAYKFKYVSVVKIMEVLFKLPETERKKFEKNLKELKMFPLKYSSEYTPKFRKAETTRVKKIRNTLIDYSYTRIGLLLLKLYYFVYNYFRKH